MLKMQLIRNACKICSYSTVTSGNVLEKLVTRSLVRVSGNDASALLQGLITNDMKHLDIVGSMFAMFLNSKGRVLYDTIVYRMPEANTYYLDVDSQVVDLVQKHLQIYRLRRKIDISLDDQYTVWAHFNPTSSNLVLPPQNYTKEIKNKKLFIFKDPRLVTLGSRILAPKGCDSELSVYFNHFKSACSPTFKWFRYKLGVGEGIEEHPPENCFPLEVNCDYLDGVSFHKGCYIGQELTARVHHTGVVRKRLMPLVFQSNFKTPPEINETIRAGEANLGKLRGYEEDVGLGLLRIEKTLAAKELIVNNTIVKTAKPNWWPFEAPKKEIPLVKS